MGTKEKWLDWVGRTGEKRLLEEQGAASGARPPNQAPRTLGCRDRDSLWASGHLSYIKPCLCGSEHRPSSVEQ